MKEYDVLVIGAGPAGYTAAIRASQLGMSVGCVDRWLNPEGQFALGGTCLNVGCIPSKALLDTSEHFYRLRHKLSGHGIRAEGATLDVPAMIGRKDKIVKTLTKGIEGLFKKNKVDWLKGHAQLQAPNEVRVTPINGQGDDEIVRAREIIIATGSSPRSIPNVEIDHQYIVDSTGALSFGEVPRRLGIIGAGVIGLELGSVWKRCGSEQVVLLEALDEFLFFCDRDIAREAGREFKKQGLDIQPGTRVTGAKVINGEVHVSYQNMEGTHEMVVDRLVVAVGRRPNTANLKSHQVELYIDESGYIHSNDYCETNIPGIYAIGDVTQGPMLAHKGAEEGVMVAERIAGHQSKVDHRTIPWVIYTWPEIAWVGQTEEQLKTAGRAYRKGSFPMRACGRALAMDETTGMVKVLADEKTDEILGVHMFGPYASEMIAEAVVAMEFGSSSEDIARTVHAHPTISEAFHEAALAVDGRTINF